VSTEAKPLLKVVDLVKHFPLRRWLPWAEARVVHAVDGVSFSVLPQRTLSLVGESGCGKTTVAKLVLRQLTPTAGRVELAGQNVHALRGKALSTYRASVQAVLQDPWSSLNPRLRVATAVGEPLRVNRGLRGAPLREEVARLLLAVGLEPALAGSFPHELSGGMRQRVAVARALSLRPALIVLDEPVSALDVSIRAQIMNLLRDLQEQYAVSYLMIAHNLATVRYLSDRVAVMYLGQIVETGESEYLFNEPLHPYTQALVSAATPPRRGEPKKPMVLKGEVPSPITPPSGCRFHTRCPFAFDRCPLEVPRLREVAPGRRVACHLYDSGLSESTPALLQAVT
jgi:oligopeptide/dipeptide ABC transporter ATP-binding protein